VATEMIGVCHKRQSLFGGNGGYSVVVEEEDFDAGGTSDNFGDVALHGLDNIHPHPRLSRHVKASNDEVAVRLQINLIYSSRPATRHR
jgi:hypothetical protein